MVEAKRNMKSKLLQKLVQLGAIGFLVWFAVHEVLHNGFATLIPFGLIGVFFVVSWWIERRFPQTTERCLFVGRLVWVLIFLSLVFTALSFINFSVSTSSAFSLSLNFIFVALIFTYMHHQKLWRQLTETGKPASV